MPAEDRRSPSGGRRAIRSRRLPSPAGCLFLLALIGCNASIAVAQADPGAASRYLSVGFGPTVTNLTHREVDGTGRSLLREAGTLPGWRIDASLAGDRWELSLRADHADGTIDYNGRTQSGAPLSTTTDTRISEAGLRLLRSLDANRRIALGAGIAYRRWDRRIQPLGSVAGLDERYTSWLLSLESRFSILRAPAAALDLEFSLRRTQRPEVSVDFGGLYDNQSIALGRQTGMRLAAPARLALGKGSTLKLEGWIEYWGFDRSASQPLLRDGRPVGTVFQPESDGRSLGAALMWEFSL